jgi:hypothetical protein
MTTFGAICANFGWGLLIVRHVTCTVEVFHINMEQTGIDCLLVLHRSNRSAVVKRKCHRGGGFVLFCFVLRQGLFRSPGWPQTQYSCLSLLGARIAGMHHQA